MKLIFSLIIIVLGLSLGLTASAQLGEQIQNSLDQTGGMAGFGESAPLDSSDLVANIGQLISIVLGLVGVIFFIIIIYSGFQWMTAGGNEDTVTTAKKRIINSVIGLVIIFLAYLITYFITQTIINTTGYEL